MIAKSRLNYKWFKDARWKKAFLFIYFFQDLQIPQSLALNYISLFFQICRQIIVRAYTKHFNLSFSQ